jgi:hypothetical protein
MHLGIYYIEIYNNIHGKKDKTTKIFRRRVVDRYFKLNLGPLQYSHD